jgi:predicted DNA-binding transcriptional regulator YafY
MKGLSSQELADLCGVSIRTIQRDLLDLQSCLNVPITQDGDRYGIVREYTLPPLFFSAYEAVSLFLACRLALRLAKKTNPHMRQALLKLSRVMPPELAARLELGLSDSRNEEGSSLGEIFETVSIAWLTRRQVKIQYLQLMTSQTGEYTLDPYFVEMFGAGHSIFVFGHARREGREGIFSFSLDRIKTAELLSTSFELPSERELAQILSSAWGKMWTRRSEKRLWHLPRAVRNGGSEAAGSQLTDSHLVTLHISSWIENHNIKASGAWDISQTEVLSADSLTKYFAEHAKMLAHDYGLPHPEETKWTDTAINITNC